MKQGSLPAPRHILHVLHRADLSWTGIGNIVRTLATGLDPARYQVSACSLSGPGPVLDELSAAGVDTFHLNLGGRVTGPRNAWALWRELRRRRADIIHTHVGGRALLEVMRHAAPHTVLHIHSHLLEDGAASPVRISPSDAEAFIAPSQFVARQFPRLPTEIIPSAVELPEQAAARTGKPIIFGTLARLAPVKDLQTMLRAFAEIVKTRPDVQLEIAGEGPEATALEALARELGLSGAVKFLGWSNSPSALLSRSHLYLSSSLSESFGLSILQAMAAGLPVVATSVGGVPELVEHGVTGVLVVAQSPNAMAQAALSLLAQPELAARMAAAARERAREFSPAKMVEKTAALYRRLLGQ